MPKLLTAYFGELDYAETSVFDFPDGLPGFEEERAFVFLRRPDAEPLIFMQSLLHPTLCFMMLPVLVACPDYDLFLAPEDLSILNLPIERQPRIGKEILCGVLVCTPLDAEPTVNLLGPVVVSLDSRIGVQVIQPGLRYSHKHPLLQEELVPCS
jgi:flagellar assembly factor FliW